MNTKIEIGNTVTIQKPDDAYSGTVGIVMYDARYSTGRYLDVRMADGSLRKYREAELNKMD